MNHIATKEVYQFYQMGPSHAGVIMDAEIRDDMPPLGISIIWIIGKITGFFISKESILEDEANVLTVILIAKFFILLLDCIFYIGASYVFVTTCFTKHKNELNYLYFAI